MIIDELEHYLKEVGRMEMFNGQPGAHQYYYEHGKELSAAMLKTGVHDSVVYHKLRRTHEKGNLLKR